MASRTRGENQTYTEEAALLLIRRRGKTAVYTVKLLYLEARSF